MNIVLFADRHHSALESLTDTLATALLPVAGKPLIEHQLDDLARNGMKEVVVVLGDHAHQIEAQVGDGRRWGLKLRYILGRGNESFDRVLQRIDLNPDENTLCIRADVLRGNLLLDFITAATFLSSEHDVIGAQCRGEMSGMALLAAANRGTMGALEKSAQPDLQAVNLHASEQHWIDDLPSYHHANMQCMRGHVRDRMRPGLEVDKGLRVGRGSKVARDVLESGEAMVGDYSHVDDRVRLYEQVVIGDHCYVDRDAVLRNTLVMPGTYVGEALNLENAIVCGPRLIRIDNGSITEIEDPVLLTAMQAPASTGRMSNALHRGAGIAALALSLPLWPLAMWMERTPCRRSTRMLLGNRREAGDPGRRHAFRQWQFDTGVPVLDHLPSLLAVCRGDLRLIGVRACGDSDASSQLEFWRRERDQAAVGLLGPANLDLPANAPENERLLAEGFHARNRGFKQDVHYLGKAVRALFQHASWQRRGLPTSAGALG